MTSISIPEGQEIDRVDAEMEDGSVVPVYTSNPALGPVNRKPFLRYSLSLNAIVNSMWSEWDRPLQIGSPS